MKTSTKATLALALLSFSCYFIAHHFYAENQRYCYSPKDRGPFHEMLAQTIAFEDSKEGAGLIKAKNCDKSKTLLRIRPSQKVKVSSNNELKVFLDGEEQKAASQSYFTSIKNLSHNYFWKESTVGEASYNLEIPAFDLYGKEQLPIRCEYYSDGVLIEAIKDTILYLDEGEQITYNYKRIAPSIGSCQSPEYYSNEVLYELNQEGSYHLEKELITTITKEEDRYKIVSSSPAGALVNMENNSHRIPVPAFDDNISYADLATELVPGTYKRSFDKSSGAYYFINEKSVGKYLAYNYDLASINIEKTISYEDCELIVHEADCQRVPAGVNMYFEEYPEDKNNTYISFFFDRGTRCLPFELIRSCS